MTPASRTGDFVELWTASSRRVYAFIVSLVPRWADADEILQETSRTVWEKFDEFQPGTNFTAWACRVAYLKVLEVRKRDRRVPPTFTDAFVGLVERELLAETEDHDPRYAALLDCLQKLSDRDRELIGRRYQEGATTAGVAQTMGRTTAWAYKTLSRLHHVLLACIERTMRREAGS